MINITERKHRNNDRKKICPEPVLTNIANFRNRKRSSQRANLLPERKKKRFPLSRTVAAAALGDATAGAAPPAAAAACGPTPAALPPAASAAADAAGGISTGSVQIGTPSTARESSTTQLQAQKHNR